MPPMRVFHKVLERPWVLVEILKMLGLDLEIFKKPREYSSYFSNEIKLTNNIL